MRNVSKYRRGQLPTLLRDVFGEDFPSLMWDEEKGYRWSPAVDVYEKDLALYFELELPGIKKGDISVEFNDGVLTISGERKAEEEQTTGSYFAKERARGAFSRSFRIGEAYDPKKLKARSEDGVLMITMGKKEESKPIAIKVD